jgi:hypothetical protein
MQLLYVDNYTPFEWFAFEKMGPGMRIHDVLIVKGAAQFTLHQDAWAITPAEDGVTAPIHMSDETHAFDGNAYSSLRVAGDTIFYKPATDFILGGRAIPPRGHEQAWAAEITIRSHGKERRQALVLRGERHWQWSLLKGWHLAPPQPCEEIELRYELAYGGSYQKADQWIRHEPNPVGRGFFPAHRMDREVHYPAARIERIDSPLSAVDKPIAVPALGPIARTWASRKRYVGTYDAAWREGLQKNQRADYAPDFDLHFFQAAHPHWIFEPYWRGDEAISLVGLSGDKPIVGQLPGWQPVLNGNGARGPLKPHAMNLDTVEIDLDRKRLYLTWRTIIDQSLQIERASVRLERLT